MLERLTVPRGHGARKRLHLLDWERDLARRVFGDAPPRQAVLALGRGNGKTTLAAAMAVHAATFADVPGAEVVLVATTETQAGRVLDVVKRFVDAHPDLADRAQAAADWVRFPAWGSRIVALPAEPSALLGLDFSLAVLDEVGAMRAETWDAVVTASGKRPESTVLGIGSPVPGSSDLLRRLVEYGQLTDDPAFWMRHYRAAEGCAVDDPEAWAAANPSFGHLIDADTMRHLAATTPEPSFRAYRLGQFVEEAGVWLAIDRWKACADVERVVADRSPIVLGFDGSYAGDSTVLIRCTVGPDPHVFTLGVWEAPPRDPHWRVPRDEVHAAVAAAFDRYDVRSLCVDPFIWRDAIEAWADRYGTRIVLEWPTTSHSRIAKAAERFNTAVLEGTLTHDGDGRLAAHVAHCHVKVTNYGPVPVKDARNSPRKIDAAIAAVIALDRAAQVPNRAARVVAF